MTKLKMAKLRTSKVTPKKLQNALQVMVDYLQDSFSYIQELESNNPKDLNEEIRLLEHILDSYKATEAFIFLFKDNYKITKHWTKERKGYFARLRMCKKLRLDIVKDMEQNPED